MYYEDYDYFYEPSKNDIVMEEIGDILKKMIRKEVVDELEALRKENAELRQFKSEKESHERKIRELEYQCKIAIENAQREAKQTRIHDLFGDMVSTGYMIRSNNTKRQKCNKCNDNRRIEYTTPLGKTAYEVCDCDGYDYFYEVAEVELLSFKIRKGYGWSNEESVSKYYRHARNIYNDKDDYNEYQNVYDVYSGESFEDVKKNNYYGTVFLDKEKCQEYCDWLNEQKKKENKQ